MSQQNSQQYFQEICNFINSVHNPSLVIPNESPNGNIIYHIYSDGEITYQKGGWAYQQRSEFTEKYPSFKKNYVDIFPIKIQDYNNKLSYAIVTIADAEKIVNMIKQYENM